MARSLTSPRLARAPDLFGDVFIGQSYEVFTDPGFVSGTLPLAAGDRRIKVSENNNALPQDRIIFHYNHFHNAIERNRRGLVGPVVPDGQFDINRYTFGIEKTFFDGLFSAEVRMPFAEKYGSFQPDLGLEGGRVGNLAVLFKGLLYYDEAIAVSAGLGFNTPTGSNVDAIAPTVPITFEVENEAFHYLPFLGVTGAPNDRFFYHAFAQLDVAGNGNDVHVNGLGGPFAGTVNDQTLLYLDASFGYWLYREPCCQESGVAVLLELHYTTALQEADLVSGGGATFGNLRNRFDALNLTTGLHFQVSDSTALRVGGVFPLSPSEDRFFDSEISASVIVDF